MARPDAKIEYPSREAVAEFVLRLMILPFCLCGGGKVGRKVSEEGGKKIFFTAKYIFSGVEFSAVSISLQN